MAGQIGLVDRLRLGARVWKVVPGQRPNPSAGAQHCHPLAGVVCLDGVVRPEAIQVDHPLAELCTIGEAYWPEHKVGFGLHCHALSATQHHLRFQLPHRRTGFVRSQADPVSRLPVHHVLGNNELGMARQRAYKARLQNAAKHRVHLDVTQPPDGLE